MGRSFNNRLFSMPIGLVTILSIVTLGGCYGAKDVRQSFPTVAGSETPSCAPITRKKTTSSARVRPPWTLVEPPDKRGMHYLVGMSNYHATERDAREEAMRHARSEFAKYTGVEVAELDEISRVIYGKASGILDPTLIGKSQSTQETDALVRRTRAKEWYFEKFIQSCRGTDQGIAFQYWVLAEVPSEEYDKVQEWKAKRESAKEARKTADRKEAEEELRLLTESHLKTLDEVETLMAKADPIAALGLLQSDWSRIYDAAKKLESSGSHVSSVVQRLHALQREVPAVVQRVRSLLIIDPGRGATVWIPASSLGPVEVPVWAWYRGEDQITPASAIPLSLKKRGESVSVAQGRSDLNGRVIFRLDGITPGQYEVSIDPNGGTLATLDPMLKAAMSAVGANLSVVQYTPDIAGAAKAGIHQLFAGPFLKPLPVKKVVMGSARYAETRMGSPFGRRLEQEIEREITKIDAVIFIRRQDKRSTRSLSQADQARSIGMLDRPQQSMSSPAIQAALDRADASLEARYALEGGVVKIDMRLIQAGTGKTVAAISVSVDKTFIPADLQLIPFSLGDSPSKLISAKTGDITLELTTQRGDGATFAGGEQIVFYVSSNQDAYLLFLYHDADGKLIQIFPNARSKDGFRAGGDYMEVPDETDVFDFDIKSPYGVEQVWVFAATEPFPTLKGKEIVHGLTLLQQNLTQAVRTLRAHGKKRGISYGEANVVVTTVEK